MKFDENDEDFEDDISKSEILAERLLRRCHVHDYDSGGILSLITGGMGSKKTSDYLLINTLFKKTNYAYLYNPLFLKLNKSLMLEILSILKLSYLREKMVKTIKTKIQNKLLIKPLHKFLPTMHATFDNMQELFSQLLISNPFSQSKYYMN